jgi:hypothetical protein
MSSQTSITSAPKRIFCCCQLYKSSKSNIKNCNVFHIAIGTRSSFVATTEKLVFCLTLSACVVAWMLGGRRVECLLASLAPQIAPLGALVKGNESRIKSESREAQSTWRVWTRRVMLRREQKMKTHGDDKFTFKRKLSSSNYRPS